MKSFAATAALASANAAPKRALPAREVSRAASAGSPTIAAQYTEAIVAYCEGLATFAHRGTRRDDIRPGLRITNYKYSAVIAFDVNACGGGKGRRI